MRMRNATKEQEIKRAGMGDGGGRYCSMTRCLFSCDCDSLTRGKSQSDLLAQRVSSSLTAVALPSQKLAILRLQERSPLRFYMRLLLEKKCANSGKKKPYTALLQCRTFCRQKWGPLRKDFGGGYGFPGFYRVFVSTTGLESFSLRPDKFSKRFSFGGGCVRFFLLCNCVQRGCNRRSQRFAIAILVSQPQSITYKGVHADLLTAREREH